MRNREPGHVYSLRVIADESSSVRRMHGHPIERLVVQRSSVAPGESDNDRTGKLRVRV